MADVRRASAVGSSSRTIARGSSSSTVRVARPVWACRRAGLRSRASDTASPTPGMRQHAGAVGVGRQQPDEAVLHARLVDGRRRSGARRGTPATTSSVRAIDTGRPQPAPGGDRWPGRRRRPRPSSLPGPQRQRPVGGDVVVGRAEEHELAVGQPRQDRVDGRQRLHPLAHRRRSRRRRAGRRRRPRRMSASTAAAVASSVRSISICVHASSGPTASAESGATSTRRSCSSRTARSIGCTSRWMRGRGARAPSASCRRGTACRR